MHNQCYIELANQSTPSALAKKLKSGSESCHVEVCKGSPEQNRVYCVKDGDFWEEGELGPGQGHRSDVESAALVAKTDGLKAVMEDHAGTFVKYHAGLTLLANAYYTESIKESVRAEFANFVARPWQQTILDLLKGTPDRRKIHWYHEPIGDVGKSYLASFLEIDHDAILLDCSKKGDLCHLLRGHRGNIVIFNITRTVGDEFMNHIYELAERVKDNSVIASKYDTCRLWLRAQHVLVFANREPDYTKWSDDRYDVVDLGECNGANCSTFNA